MKKCFSLLIFLLLAETAASQQANNMSPATRWLHTSAEYQAIVRQTYTLASELIRDLAEGHEPGTWAVALDADYTVISNSLYEWESEINNLESTPERWEAWIKRQESPPLPGVIEFLEEVHELGGHIAIVTNRYLAECPDTEANFRKYAIPYDIMLCRGEEREKEPRWEAIQDGTALPELPPLEIVMWIGDNIRDFPQLDQGLRFENDENFSLFGTQYLLLPNPVFGSWMKNTPRIPAIM